MSRQDAPNIVWHPRRKAAVGDAVRVRGKPGVHVVVEARTNGSAQIGCRSSWSSSTTIRPVDDPVDCTKCLTSTAFP